MSVLTLSEVAEGKKVRQMNFVRSQTLSTYWYTFQSGTEAAVPILHTQMKFYCYYVPVTAE